VILRTLIMVMALLTSSTAMQAGVWDTIKNVKNLWDIDKNIEEPTVKVLIADRSQGSFVEIKGGYNIYNPKNGHRISTRFFGKQQYVQPLTRGIKWGEEFPGIYQLKLIPDDQETQIYVDGIQYKGIVEIYQIGDKLSVINEVPVEDYLKSTLANSFEEDTKEEVMAAIVIAARTEACYHAAHGRDAFWHVTASDVGYYGYGVTRQDNGVDDIVNKTKNFVMKRYNNENADNYFAARWTKHSAGKTIPFHVMYRRDMGAPLDGVEVPIAAANREETIWTYSVSKREFAEKADVAEKALLEVYSDAFSSKIYSVRLQDERGIRDVTFFELQDILGKNNILSSDFTVSSTEGTITFTGYGEGAGVGICLYTAEVLAEKGMNASQILSMFFSDATIHEAA
jgi:stage II sporulation protein D